LADIAKNRKQRNEKKMKKLLIIGVGITLVLISCVTNKYISKNVNTTAITEIKYFAPLSYVSLIQKEIKCFKFFIFYFKSAFRFRY
jgi:hypothetical protein